MTPQTRTWSSTSNPVNRLFGFSAAVVLITNYESQPIVRDLKRSATAFPLFRSLEIKNGDKTTVEKLFETFGRQLRDDQPQFHRGERERQEQQEGPADARRRRPVQHRAAGNNNGRFVVVGSSSWLQNNILGSRSFAAIATCS